MNRADLESLSLEQLIELVLAQSNTIAALTNQVAELEAKLGLPPKTPDNSSLPPSQGRKPAVERKRKRRRKGRPGVARALDPDPTQFREMRADCCPHCRGDLAAAAQAPCESYDHIEIPPIRPEVTRVTLMGGTCPHCAKAFKAAPPADMAPGSPFGENVRALTLHLRFSQGIGFDRLHGVFRDVFGLAISQGALVNMARAAAAPFAAQAARLRERLLRSPVLASDETGLRVAGKNGWLWVIHHADSAAFRATPSRAKRVLEEFLGKHRPEFWISDRYGAQKGLARSGHQFCLAHLIRDAQYALDAGDTGFAPGFLALLKRACRLGRVRDRLSDDQLEACHRKFVKKLSELLQRAATHPKGAKLQKAMGQGPRQSLPLRHQPGARADQQRLRTRAQALRHLPQDHRRLPHRLGRRALRRHPIGAGDRPTPLPPAPSGHRPHPPGPPAAAPTRLSRREQLLCKDPGGSDGLD